MPPEAKLNKKPPRRAAERMQILLERTLEEFSLDTEKLVIGAITNDDFVKIKTNNGNAVLISEAEWNILRDVVQTALHMLLHKQ